MRRKIVKQGAATMMISLPAKWVKKNKLEKGDEINIEEKGNNLVIGSEETAKKRKQIRVEITENNKRDIKNILTHVYRKGFDRILVVGVNKELLKKINSIVNKLLLGFEMTEIEPGECIIENISEPNESKYEVMLKKIFLIIKECHDILREDFYKNKISNFHEMEEMRNNCDKFILFCRRLLIKERIDRDELLEWEFLTFLMHIQHTYYYLHKYAFENKVKIDSNVVRLLDILKQYFDLFYDAYYNKNIDAIHKINDLKEDYHFGKCLRLVEKSKGKESVLYSYLKEIFRLIQIGTSPILSEIFEKIHKESNQSTSA